MAEAFLSSQNMFSNGSNSLTQSIVEIYKNKTSSGSWSTSYWTTASLNGFTISIPNNTSYASLILIIHTMQCNLVGTATVTYNFYPWMAYGYLNGQENLAIAIKSSGVSLSDSNTYQYNDILVDVYNGSSTITSGTGNHTVSLPNSISAVIPQTSLIGFYFGSCKSSGGTSDATSKHTLTVNYSLYGIQYSV